MQTLGEKRVVKAFNSEGLPAVEEIKRACADLIDWISGIPNVNSQTARWKATAMTEIETGCMYAVKAVTAGQEREEDEVEL